MLSLLPCEPLNVPFVPTPGEFQYGSLTQFQLYGAFRGRVSERQSLQSLNFEQVAAREAIQFPKSVLVESEIRSYALPVAGAFRIASKEYPSISVDPEVMGGAPCVVGTRIPVYMILDAIEYHGTIEGAIRSYPRLTVEQVKDAIGFAKLVVECPLADEA